MLNPGVASLGSTIKLFVLFIQVTVTLWVTEIHIGLLNKGRNVLKLVEGVELVILDNATEYFGQVLVQVRFVLGVNMQLLFDFLQRFRIDAHF